MRWRHLIGLRRTFKRGSGAITAARAVLVVILRVSDRGRSCASFLLEVLSLLNEPENHIGERKSGDDYLAGSFRLLYAIKLCHFLLVYPHNSVLPALL